MEERQRMDQDQRNVDVNGVSTKKPQENSAPRKRGRKPKATMLEQKLREKEERRRLDQEPQDQRNAVNGVGGIAGSSRNTPRRGKGIATLERELKGSSSVPFISPSYDGKIPGDLCGYKFWNNSRDNPTPPPGYTPIWNYSAVPPNPTPPNVPARPSSKPSVSSSNAEQIQPNVPMRSSNEPSVTSSHAEPIYPPEQFQPNVPTRLSYVPSVSSFPAEPPSNQISRGKSPMLYPTEQLQPNSPYDPSSSNFRKFGDPIRVDRSTPSDNGVPFKTSEHRHSYSIRDSEPSKDSRENSAMNRNPHTSEHRDSELREFKCPSCSKPIPAPSPRENRAMNINPRDSEMRESDRPLCSSPNPAPNPSIDMRENSAMNINPRTSEYRDSELRELDRPCSNPTPEPSSTKNKRENENTHASEQRDLMSRKLGSNSDLSHLREDDVTDRNFLTLSLPTNEIHSSSKENSALNENFPASEQRDSKSRELGSNHAPYPDLSHLREDDVTDRNFLTLSLPTNSNTE